MESRQPSSRGGAALPGLSSLPQRTNSLRGEREGSRRGQPSQAPQQAPESQYVVYLRLPFERNGFIDPPQVDWDAAKERYLWKVLFRGNRNVEIDWDQLSVHLKVSRAFLLQQAAWLYERELSKIQAQMRRVGGLNTSVNGPPASPNLQSPGGFSPGGFPPQRSGAPALEPRPSSSFATRITTAEPGTVSRPSSATSSSPVRAMAQPMSRTASGAQTVRPGNPSRFSEPITADSPRDTSPSVSGESVELSASSSSSDDEERTISNRAIRKLPAFLKKTHNSSSDDDTGEEAVFLPFSSGRITTSSGADMAGTVTLPGRKGKEPLLRAHRKTISIAQDDSSAGPSSPSMGSSFSDLSGIPSLRSQTPMSQIIDDDTDASVSQSAMEEAYLSTMQAGGMASRMSSLGQAVRSRSGWGG